MTRKGISKLAIGIITAAVVIIGYLVYAYAVQPQLAPSLIRPSAERVIRPNTVPNIGPVQEAYKYCNTNANCPIHQSCYQHSCRTRNCTDSDGGIVPNVYGIVRVSIPGAPNSSSSTYPDYCNGNSTVTEYYCTSPNSTNNAASLVVNCTYGCSNGRCNTCTPNCAGKQCGDNGCGGSCGTCYPGQICTGNVCVNQTTPTCSDTDGGRNFLVRGTVSGILQTGLPYNLTDYCTSGTHILEYLCSGSTPQSYLVGCSAPAGVGPGYICQNGACVLNQTQYPLAVSKTGSGNGTVISSPSGINCGSDCTENYNSGTSVTLTATPAVGSTFSEWSGSCTGTGSCVILMNANKAVTATFVLNQSNVTLPDLTITNVTILSYNLTSSNGTSSFYSVYLRATVKNIGTGPASNSTTKLAVLGFGYNNLATPSLASGVSTNTYTTINNIPSGYRTAIATADVIGVIQESNEVNNMGSTSFTLP